MKHDLQWFKDRIKTRIYRDYTTCTCNSCEDVAKNGLIIQDEMQAQYLFDVQCGMMINYRDKQ